MRAVSYTRSTSCKIGEESPKDVIKQQNDHIRAYAKTHGLKIVKTYSDRKRDEKEESSFRQLLEDGMSRKFDALIVDSVYRAGKSLWSARKVMLETFCFAGIGFIVVEDDFNSMEKSKDEAKKYFEAKDIDQRAAFLLETKRNLRAQGKVRKCDVRYGFKLSEEQTMVVDEKTAPIVRHIFELCASGNTPSKTAKILTSERILIPSTEKKEVDDPYRWSPCTIRDLIQSTAYIGHWSRTIKGEVMEYTNQPIVSEELFQKAQKVIIDAPKRKSPVPKHIFSGLIVENRYGTHLIYSVSQRTGFRYFQYNGKYRLDPECENSYIGYDTVESAVRTALKKEKESAEKALVSIHKEGQTEIEARIRSMQETASRYAFRIADMQKQGILDEQLVTESECFWEKMKEDRELLKKVISEENPWVQLYLTWDESAELESKLVKKYVSKVYVENLETVTVAVKEEKWKLALPELWRN